jgi:hypothetical protein
MAETEGEMVVVELQSMANRIMELGQDLEGSSIGMAGIPKVDTALKHLMDARDELLELKETYEEEEDEGLGFLPTD